MYNNGLCFEDRATAEEVLWKMEDMIDIYGCATIADLYDFSGAAGCRPDNKYGWTCLKNADIRRTEHGYTLSLPSASSLSETLLDAKEKCARPTANIPLEHQRTYEDYCKKDVELTRAIADRMVSHPDHYQTKSGLEAIDVIEAFTEDLVGIEATDTGNVLKYMCRWKHKNGLQDLKKAKWYLEHLINHMEKEND